MDYGIQHLRFLLFLLSLVLLTPTLLAAPTQRNLDSLFEAAKHGIGSQRLCFEVVKESQLEYEEVVPPIEILQDNQSTIKVVKNFDSSKLRRYMDLRYRWLQDRRDSHNLNVTYIPTEFQRADIFTKSLGKTVFTKLRSLLGVMNCSQFLRG